MHTERIARCLILLFVATAAHAKTWYVATTGNDNNTGNSPAQAFQTIQVGLDAAISGDTVQVAAGTYTGSLTWGGRDIILQGAGASQTAIDGLGANPCLYISGTTSAARISGITFQNGNSMFDDGGGIHGNETDVQIMNCTFSNNRADNNGGALNVSAGNVTVNNCVFNNNSGLFGGGIGFQHGNETVTNCTFIGNSASKTGGGMVLGIDANATVTNCGFTGNNAGATPNASDAAGGGMSIFQCSPTITNCVFYGNSVSAPHAAREDYGGAMSISGAAPTVTNCSFTNNTAGTGGLEGGSGGAVSNSGGTPIFRNCLFSNNTANTGQTPSRGGAFVNFGIPVLTNCTFTKNAAALGTALWNDETTGPTVTNCILWGDTGGPNEVVNNPGTTVITYCDVQGGYAGIGNINVDPTFVNGAAGDLHLQSTSPCIDAGILDAPSLPATDLVGAPRHVGAAPDMGVFESTAGSLFVDRALGSDVNSGAWTSPFATVTHAISIAAPGNSIHVKEGNYGTDKPRITKPLHLRNWEDTGQARVGKP